MHDPWQNDPDRTTRRETPRRHRTPYGTVDIAGSLVTIRASSAELYAWANRPDHRWPCSALAASDGFGVAFDRNGVVDYFGETDFLREELSADELNAWSSDVLRGVLPADHPAYFVAVGQFA